MARYIDADKIYYSNEYGLGLAALKQDVDDISTEDMIPIPKGATNGDVIKMLFPNCRELNMVLENEDGEDFEISFDITSGDGSNWNATYKKGE